MSWFNTKTRRISKAVPDGAVIECILFICIEPDSDDNDHEDINKPIFIPVFALDKEDAYDSVPEEYKLIKRYLNASVAIDEQFNLTGFSVENGRGSSRQVNFSKTASFSPGIEKKALSTSYPLKKLAMILEDLNLKVVETLLDKESGLNLNSIESSDYKNKQNQTTLNVFDFTNKSQDHLILAKVISQKFGGFQALEKAFSEKMGTSDYRDSIKKELSM